MLPNKISNLFANTPIGYDSILLSNAIDASNVGILITDNGLPDNPIVYCNLSFQKLTGYLPSEIIGKNCRFLQGQYKQRNERKLIRSALSNGDEIVIELRNQKKNGEMFWNELHISPVKNEFGTVTHFIGIQHDITKRKDNDGKNVAHSDERSSPVKNNESVTRSEKSILKALKLLLPFQ